MQRFLTVLLGILLMLPVWSTASWGGPRGFFGNAPAVGGFGGGFVGGGRGGFVRGGRGGFSTSAQGLSQLRFLQERAQNLREIYGVSGSTLELNRDILGGNILRGRGSGANFFPGGGNLLQGGFGLGRPAARKGFWNRGVVRQSFSTQRPSGGLSVGAGRTFGWVGNRNPSTLVRRGPSLQRINPRSGVIRPDSSSTVFIRIR